MQSQESYKKLEQRQKVLFVLVIVLFSLVTGLLSFIFFTKDEDIITTKGIVIVDENGKERILIGAPIPISKDRVRDDLNKAKAAWGSDDQLELNKEWDWFEELNHDCYGMLVLDENGHDRLAIGSPTPDPNIGIRIGPATGIELNDEQGYERSGYSYMPIGKGSRVVLGLDRPGSAEGATFSILEDGSTGLSVFNSKTKSSLFLGNSEANTYMTPGNEAYFGLAIKDSTNAVEIINR